MLCGVVALMVIDGYPRKDGSCLANTATAGMTYVKTEDFPQIAVPTNLEAMIKAKQNIKNQQVVFANVDVTPLAKAIEEAYNELVKVLVIHLNRLQSQIDVKTPQALEVKEESIEQSEGEIVPVVKVTGTSKWNWWRRQGSTVKRNGFLSRKEIDELGLEVSKIEEAGH